MLVSKLTVVVRRSCMMFCILMVMMGRGVMMSCG
jgi:hypothetical protein